MRQKLIQVENKEFFPSWIVFCTNKEGSRIDVLLHPFTILATASILNHDTKMAIETCYANIVLDMFTEITEQFELKNVKIN